MLADKNLTYASAAVNNIPVPPWRIASNVEDFIEAYWSLKEEINEERIVMKPSVGIGMKGFRVITDVQQRMESLFDEPSHDVSLNNVVRLLSQAKDSFPEFILMPFLDEPEISVDCLSDGEGNLLRAIARSKTDGKTPQFVSEAHIHEIVEQWSGIHKMKYITNTQFRFWHDKVVLLETNTRISGGLPTSLLTGVNVLSEAIRLLLGEEVIVAPHQSGGFYTETPSYMLAATNNINKLHMK